MKICHHKKYNWMFIPKIIGTFLVRSVISEPWFIWFGFMPVPSTRGPGSEEEFSFFSLLHFWELKLKNSQPINRWANHEKVDLLRHKKIPPTETLVGGERTKILCHEIFKTLVYFINSSLWFTPIGKTPPVPVKTTSVPETPTWPLNSPTRTGKNHTPVRKNSPCIGKTPTVAEKIPPVPEKTHPYKKKLKEFENPFC